MRSEVIPTRDGKRRVTRRSVHRRAQARHERTHPNHPLHPSSTAVAVTVYADVRLRLQHYVVDTLSNALGSLGSDKATHYGGVEPPPCPALVR